MQHYPRPQRPASDNKRETRIPGAPFSALRGPLHKGGEPLRKGFTIYAKALLTFAISVLLLFGILFTLTELVIISLFLGIE